MDSLNDKEETKKQEPLNELGILELTISKVREMQITEFKKGFGFIIKNVEQLGLAVIQEISFPRKEHHEEVLYDLIPEWIWPKKYLNMTRTIMSSSMSITRSATLLSKECLQLQKSFLRHQNPDSWKEREIGC